MEDSTWTEISRAAKKQGINRFELLQKALDGELNMWVQHEVSHNAVGEGMPFVVYPGRLVSATDAPEGLKVAMPDGYVLMFDSQRTGLRGGRFEVTPRVTANMELLRSVRSVEDYMPVELKRGVILRDINGNYFGVSGDGPAAMVQVGVIGSEPQRQATPTPGNQGAPEGEAAVPPPVVANEWVSDAQTRAQEIIRDEKANDRYPDQLGIADRIAREFRAAGRVGTGGKPISGAYIKRHALRGITSAVGKQLSTKIVRGK